MASEIKKIAKDFDNMIKKYNQDEEIWFRRL